MNIEAYRDYCIAKPGVTEHFPFDDKVLVFKVMNKMFALCDVNTFESINLKCDPERAIDLRAEYPAIIPGYHMSKVHWNTLQMDGSLSDKLILELIDHSYDLIVKSLPKKVQKEWSEL
jgi:predicted DNA-binding protein (MmcQ/YjbR family)